MHDNFYPRDAMPVRYMLRLHNPICLSVTRRYCTKTAERIELIFGTETPDYR